MPHHDFLCDPEGGGCGHEIRDQVLTFEEFDKFKADGQPCPECGKPMLQLWDSCRFHFPTRVTSSGLVPTSKRGKAQLMEKRYSQRNARLEKLPPGPKHRMEQFFARHDVRKSPPSEPGG